MRPVLTPTEMGEADRRTIDEIVGLDSEHRHCGTRLDQLDRDLIG